MKAFLQKKKTYITIATTIALTWLGYLGGFDAATGEMVELTLGQAVSLTGVQLTLLFQKVGQNRLESKVEKI